MHPEANESEAEPAASIEHRGPRRVHAAEPQKVGVVMDKAPSFFRLAEIAVIAMPPGKTVGARGGECQAQSLLRDREKRPRPRRELALVLYERVTRSR
jgi:hypothetical protein